MKNKIISVAGYGSTGSSAVVNYLEEFDNCFIMEENLGYSGPRWT